MSVLNTPPQIHSFRARVIATALEVYAKTGVKVNKAYTPTAMMKAAQELTGKTFAKRDYLGAAKAIREIGAS